MPLPPIDPYRITNTWHLISMAMACMDGDAVGTVTGETIETGEEIIERETWEIPIDQIPEHRWLSHEGARQEAHRITAKIRRYWLMNFAVPEQFDGEVVAEQMAKAEQIIAEECAASNVKPQWILRDFSHSGDGSNGRVQIRNQIIYRLKHETDLDFAMIAELTGVRTAQTAAAHCRLYARENNVACDPVSRRKVVAA